jgi:ribonuclease P protein component
LAKVNGIYCLRKKEIIRGYNSFKNILTDSKLITNSFLRLNIQVKEEIKYSKENKIIKDPLNNVKVGFVVSKRIVRKASVRNRMKRLSREAYRLNKSMLEVNEGISVYMLFGYSEKHKDNFGNLDIDVVNANMRTLLLKVSDFLNKK